MQVSAIKTPKITAGSYALEQLLDQCLPDLAEGSVVVITSKIVSLCEGRVVAQAEIDKETLIERESQHYLKADLSAYGHHFTITDNTLAGAAGIDLSNGEGQYILWPSDSQRTANQARSYLRQARGLDRVGVIITDSTSRPLRRGTVGIALAHSGFSALNDYIGQPDLFGHPLQMTMANVAEGLAAAAVLVMGEGAEQTPLCVVSSVDFVDFQQADPSPEELAETYIRLEDDLYAPFLMAVDWQPGGRAEAGKNR